MAGAEEVTTNPVISVIIPCYNQAKYLSDAVESVLNQNYVYWECIIVDDGSTDDTKIIADGYLAKDLRIKYERKENGGLSSARNIGLQIAKGEYIQFLDSDDVLDAGKFDVLFGNELGTKRSKLFLSNFKSLNDESGSYDDPYCDLSFAIDLNEIIQHWDSQFSIPIHCAIIHKSLLKEFDERLLAKEDWVMWINIFSQINAYEFIDKPLAIYRLHKSSMSKDQTRMETNTLQAYSIIYDTLDDTNKTVLVARILRDYEKTIRLKNQTIDFYRNTYSYKFGHFILSPLKVLRKLYRMHGKP